MHWSFSLVRLLVLGMLLVIRPAASASEQEFRLERPDAQSVGLVAEFNDWKSQPMSKGSDGIWSITVSLSPGAYGYKFLVNGNEWLFDPQNSKRKIVNGIENSAIEITGDMSARPPVITPASTSSDVPLMPGDVTTFDVPLSAKEQIESAQGGNSPITTAKIALGTPADFDPHKTWPLLIISATVNASNIELLGAYKQAALDAGWLIMAADAPAKPKEDKTERRLAMIDAALDFLGAHWPESKTWPLAAGGFSGGAKRSAFVAAWLLKEPRRVVGILMGGCNEDTATIALKRFRPPFTFTQLPIFLSSGATDKIADPEMIHSVERSMKFNGFRYVRFESYNGAHEVYPEHTTEALRWFTSGPGPSATPRPKSDFDTFFKKP